MKNVAAMLLWLAMALGATHASLAGVEHQLTLRGGAREDGHRFPVREADRLQMLSFLSSGYLQ